MLEAELLPWKVNELLALPEEASSRLSPLAALVVYMPIQTEILALPVTLAVDVPREIDPAILAAVPDRFIGRMMFCIDTSPWLLAE